MWCMLKDMSNSMLYTYSVRLRSSSMHFFFLFNLNKNTSDKIHQERRSLQINCHLETEILETTKNGSQNLTKEGHNH